MADDGTGTVLGMVAAATVAAAHRRDHGHQQADTCCRPHQVEVICLGERAVAVCHDCGADSGYLAGRAAFALAASHREQTLTADVGLGDPAAA